MIRDLNTMVDWSYKRVTPHNFEISSVRGFRGLKIKGYQIYRRRPIVNIRASVYFRLRW